MFATLLGSLPRPPLADDAAPEALLDAVLELQVQHGLEPLTDAGWALDRDDPVAAWRATAARTDGLVKAVVDGPFSGGRDVAEVRGVLLGLAEAGCRWIEVHEPGATGIGADADDRARFMDAHATLTAGFGDDVHLSLAITGGSADGAGIDTVLAGAYASLALDLIDGPENWRLATSVAGRAGPDLRRLLDAGGQRRRPGAAAVGSPVCGLDPGTRPGAGRARDRRITRGAVMVGGGGEGASAGRGGSRGGGARR